MSQDSRVLPTEILEEETEHCTRIPHVTMQFRGFVPMRTVQRRMKCGHVDARRLLEEKIVKR